MNKITLKIMLAAFIFSSFAYGEEILVVTSNKSTINEVSINQVKQLYLGNAQQTGQGIEIFALDRKSSADELRAKFYKNSAGMSNAQLKAYWSQRIFTGRGYPPKAAEDLAELKRILNENPQFISFISTSELDPSFKIILKVQSN